MSAAWAAPAEPARSAVMSRMSVRLIKIDDSSMNELGMRMKRGFGRLGDASD
jgi:hypothetical protein